MRGHTHGVVVLGSSRSAPPGGSVETDPPVPSDMAETQPRIHYKAHTIIDALTVEHKPGYMSLELGHHVRLPSLNGGYVPLCCISFPIRGTQHIMALFGGSQNVVFKGRTVNTKASYINTP
jgi:hypothetical protein